MLNRMSTASQSLSPGNEQSSLTNSPTLQILTKTTEAPLSPKLSPGLLLDILLLFTDLKVSTLVLKKAKDDTCTFHKKNNKQKTPTKQKQNSNKTFPVKFWACSYQLPTVPHKVLSASNNLRENRKAKI